MPTEEGQKGWTIKSGESHRGNDALVAVDSESGEYIANVAEKIEGEFRRSIMLERALKEKGYNPHSQGYSYDEVGRISESDVFGLFAKGQQLNTDDGIRGTIVYVNSEEVE